MRSTGRSLWRPAVLAFSASALSCAASTSTSKTSASHGPPPTCLYEVTESPGGVELAVTATFPARAETTFIVAEHAEVFLVSAEVLSGKEWHEVRRVGVTWTIPECATGCRVRYRYLLADAAAALGDIALARKSTRVTASPPSTWLLRPEHAIPGTRLHFHVAAAPGESFVTGVFTAPGVAAGSGIFEAVATDDIQLPYSAFGDLRLHELDGATLALLPGPLPEPEVVDWASASLAAVKGFYGRLTVPHVLILVEPGDGDDVGFGSTMGYSGAAIAVRVGSASTARALKRDWVLVHELVHTALPDLPIEQHWLEEGLATYVEPLARYRQGALSQEDVWGEWAHRMEKGEPEAGDKGLNQTHTWGRTYWGGALFCLVADVEIRTRTQGKAKLEDALKAVLANDGSIAVTWPIERWLAVGDAATGTTELHDLFVRMADHPEAVDLPAFFRKLGVIAVGEDGVRFDDAAELAWVRRAMTPPR
jgi:hypothetical protein